MESVFVSGLRCSPLQLNLHATVFRVDKMIFLIDSLVVDDIRKADDHISQHFLTRN